MSAAGANNEKRRHSTLSDGASLLSVLAHALAGRDARAPSLTARAPGE